MIIAYSGGSPIPECNLDHPAIMVSYFINRKKKSNEPDARFHKLMKVRRKAKGDKREAKS